MTDLSQLLAQGLEHHRAGRRREAEIAYRQVLRQQPANADALHWLGMLAHAAGHSKDAIDLVRRSIASNPSRPRFYSNLAMIFTHLRRYAEAAEALRRQLALTPDDPAALTNYGATLIASVQPEAALAPLQAALRVKPGHLSAIYNLAEAHSKLRHFDEAMRYYRDVLALAPDHAKARFALGTGLLRQGNFAEGWKGYEWRWRLEDQDPPLRSRKFDKPLWDGSDLAGKTILVYGEQGLGDSIQFVRFLPEVAARGGRIVLECFPPLLNLFQSLPHVERLIARGDFTGPYDVRIPLLSLPGILRTTLENLPATVPYLRAPEDKVHHWRDRLIADANGQLNVGLAWSGNLRMTDDPYRSLPSSALAPLAHVTNINWFSLQKGELPSDRILPPDLAAGLRLRDYTAQLHDLADTAGFIEALDLVISSDTSIAHLAGALGKPVWTPLGFFADWRWLLHRTDSPWYPTMRPFRQTQLREWLPVIQHIASELARLTTAS